MGFVAFVRPASLGRSAPASQDGHGAGLQSPLQLLHDGGFLRGGPGEGRPGGAPGRGEDLLDGRRAEAVGGHVALPQAEPLDVPGGGLGADPDPAGGAGAVQADPVDVPAPDQDVDVDRHRRAEDRLEEVVVPYRCHRVVQVQAQSAGSVLPRDVDNGAERLAQVDVAGMVLVEKPGDGGGLHVEVVGAGDVAGPALADVQAGGVGQVGEVADPVGGELGAAAAEQQPAPEGVLGVPPAEGLQLDRLQWQEQRIIRLRAAQHRRLDATLVTRQRQPPTGA